MYIPSSLKVFLVSIALFIVVTLRLLTHTNKTLITPTNFKLNLSDWWLCDDLELVQPSGWFSESCPSIMCILGVGHKNVCRPRCFWNSFPRCRISCCSVCNNWGKESNEDNLMLAKYMVIVPPRYRRGKCFESTEDSLNPLILN